MQNTVTRRIYIDHDAAHEEAIIRRVLVTPARRPGGTVQQAHASKNANTLLGLGRLVRGRLIRRCR